LFILRLTVHLDGFGQQAMITEQGMRFYQANILTDLLQKTRNSNSQYGFMQVYLSPVITEG